MVRTAKHYCALRWALIPAIAIHNFEEWLTFPRIGRGVDETFEFLGIGLQSSEWEITQLALILATLFPAIIIAYSGLGEQTRYKNILACTIAGVFFANVFLPHIPSAFTEGGYSPGLISAVLINFPLCLLIWRSAIAEGVLSFRQIAGSALVGLLLLFPSIVATMLLADQLLQL